jgi:hypothetical protein
VAFDVFHPAITEEQVAAGLVELGDLGKAEAEQSPVEWTILSDELDRRLDAALRAAMQSQDDEEPEGSAGTPR